MHIGIAGNIGSGKTTLTRMLAGHYGWTPQYEAVSYNPYLEDYYKDRKDKYEEEHGSISCLDANITPQHHSISSMFHLRQES